MSKANLEIQGITVMEPFSDVRQTCQILIQIHNEMILKIFIHKI